MNLVIAFGFGSPMEIGIIAVVVMVLFGGSKLAGFGKSAGEALKEFKKATRDEPEPATIVEPPAAVSPTTVVSTKE